MAFRRYLQIALTLSGTMMPLAASAQNGGSVTVAPLGAAAPALSLQLLGVAAVALGIFALFRLRRPRGAVGQALVLIVAAMTAGIAYSAASNVTVSGDECDQVTVKPYDAHADVQLESQCPNPIRIIDLELDCDLPCDQIHGETLPVPDCEVGLVVNPGEKCQLPQCSHT